MNTDDDWRYVHRETGRALGWGARTIIAIIIIAGVITGGIWLFNVATSGVKGQGDGIIKNNSAENWIKQQAKFEELHANYETIQVRIDEFKKIADANPNDAISQTNYQGQVSKCTDIVAEYNAATRSFLSQDWKSIDLPPTLDPATCTRS